MPANRFLIRNKEHGLTRPFSLNTQSYLITFLPFSVMNLKDVLILALFTFTQSLIGCLGNEEICSVTEEEADPALKEMSFDIGYGTEYFTAYVQPSIYYFSKGEHKTAKIPSMVGYNYFTFFLLCFYKFELITYIFNACEYRKVLLIKFSI